MLVASNGNILLEQGYGMADREAKRAQRGDAQGARASLSGRGQARRPAADRRVPQGDEGRDQLIRSIRDAARLVALL